MLRLLDAPGARRDVYHYVVADGVDAPRRLFRLHFGDGKLRWARLESVEKGWKAAGHALLVVWPHAHTDSTLRQAVALEGAGRAEEAVALYRRVLAVRPGSVRAWVDLGNAEADRGRKESAEEAYRRALDVSPDDIDALNNLAWLLLEAGERLEEAESLAARAASPPGESRPQARETLGRVQLARGRCAEAERTFDDALGAGDAIPEPTLSRLRDGRDRARACRGAP
jgi:Flp pilus assembly protein TadD